METYRETLTRLAHQINAQDFDHPFRIYPLGTLGEALEGTYAPTVMHVEDEPTPDDVEIDGAGWEALTGLTGQYSYRGAVMHASEYVGTGIAEAMWEEAQEAGHGVTYVLTTVECYPTDDDPEPEPAGWAILRHTA